MTGSGEARSIQEDVTARSWDMLSWGVKGESAGVSAGMRGIGTLSSSAVWYDERMACTLVWKWWVVMGVVIISYF